MPSRFFLPVAPVPTARLWKRRQLPPQLPPMKSFYCLPHTAKQQNRRCQQESQYMPDHTCTSFLLADFL